MRRTVTAKKTDINLHPMYNNCLKMVKSTCIAQPIFAKIAIFYFILFYCTESSARY